ncbi:MAG: hypothetical protein ACR2M0_12050 [Chloroflexia bacterium]
MIWIIYAVVVLVVSGFIGMHLGRFREAYTEMTGMMAGMTMGMLNGFVLGFAAAAATEPNGMFWGNLFGILLGLSLGWYFGRAGGLMGVMDGAMGGVMGGSMGAMLSVMVRYIDWQLTATALLLGALYIAGMIGLVVLIERSAPEHAALHRLAPMFTRAIAAEVGEVQAAATEQEPAPRRMLDYYAFLGVFPRASEDEIIEAYLLKVEDADPATVARAERALAVLSDREQRADYDKALAANRAALSGVDRRREKEPPAGGGTGRASSEITVRPTRSAAGAPGRRTAVQARRQQPAPRSNALWLLAVIPVLAVIIGAFILSNNSSESGFTPSADGAPDAALLAQAVTAPLGVDGVQTLDLVVDGSTISYKPSVIKVKQGVPVRFNLSTEGPDPG